MPTLCKFLAITGAMAAVLATPSLAEDLPPEVLLIAHTLQANKKLLTQLPQYTCLETLSRYQANRRTQKLRKQDVVQLDVGVGRHEEIYSWPGADTFSSKDLPALVGHGMLATGLFENFANVLFTQGVGIVRASGTSLVDGRRAFSFTYTIPSLQNSWNVNWLGARGPVGEQGQFWVDESDLTLLRLDVMATDIPFNIPLQSVTVTIQYRVLLAGQERVLIPQIAGIRALEWNGTLHQEEAEFSHCRAFTAESSLAAENSTAEDLTKTVERYEAQREILPAGLMFPIQLETPVQADKTNIGDPISGVLERPVKTSIELIPKGAILKGRVRELERLDYPPNTFLVGIEFDELTWPGHSAAFFASLFSMQPLAGVESNLSSQHVEKESSIAFRVDRTTEQTIIPLAIPGVASFFLNSAGANLPKGFRMDWRTQEVRRH